MNTTASPRMPPGTTLTAYMMWSAIRCLSSSGQTQAPALQRQAPCTESFVKHSLGLIPQRVASLPLSALHSCLEPAS